jgi:hypothetical protein
MTRRGQTWKEWKIELRLFVDEDVNLTDVDTLSMASATGTIRSPMVGEKCTSTTFGCIRLLRSPARTNPAHTCFGYSSTTDLTRPSFFLQDRA